MQPTAFISYSWDNIHAWGEQNEEWVTTLANRLSADNILVSLDKWQVQPGDAIPPFMEKAITNNDKVLIVCTPRYKYSSDNRQGAVGYESHIISSLILQSGDHRKFITLIKQGGEETSVPTGLIGKYHIYLNDAVTYEKQYNLLLDAIHGRWHTDPSPLASANNNRQLATNLNLSFALLQTLDNIGLKIYITHFKKCIQANSQQAAAWFGLGLCTLHYASYNAAILHMERAVSLNSLNADYHYYLALALCKGKNPGQLSNVMAEKVLALLKKAIAIDDEQAKYYVFLYALFTDYYSKKGLSVAEFPNASMMEHFIATKFKDIEEIKRLIGMLQLSDIKSYASKNTERESSEEDNILLSLSKKQER